METSPPPFNARGLPEQIEQLMFPVRVALWSYGCIGGVGLILASVGLAGVTAYSVTQRRREIGIRIALGARSVDMLGLMAKEGAVLVTLGAPLLLAALALTACYLLARNSLRIDRVVALRQE